MISARIRFWGGIAFAVGFVLLWVCGVASALCLMVAILAGVMFLITGNPHDGRIALAYLGNAAVPFILTFAAAYYRSKFRRKPLCVAA